MNTENQPKPKKSKRGVLTTAGVVATLFIGIGIGSASSGSAATEKDELEAAMETQSITWQEDLDAKNKRLDEIEAKYAAAEKELAVKPKEVEVEKIVETVPDACYDLTDDIDTLLTITTEYIELVPRAAQAGATLDGSEVRLVTADMEKVTERVNDLAPILVKNRNGCTGE